MLREIKGRYRGGRIFAGDFTSTATPSVAGGVGVDNFTGLVRASAGRIQLTYKQPFARSPVVVGTVNVGAFQGANFILETLPTTSALDIRIFNSASSPVDGTADIIAHGWTSSDISRGMLQPVEISQRSSRIVTGRITGATGAVVKGTSDFSCTRTSQGIYTITFKRAPSKTPVVIPMVISTTGGFSAGVQSKSASGCVIRVGDTAGAVQDKDFYLVVVAQNTKEEHGLAFARVQSPLRKPRVIATRIESGVITVNAPSFTSLTTNGTGDYSFNLKDPFAQECVVLASTTNSAGYKTHVHTGSATAPRVYVTNQAGTATAPTSMDVLIFGSDDPSEY